MPRIQRHRIGTAVNMGVVSQEDLRAAVDAAITQATELPDIPDLFLHFDAQQLDATDGQRLASWTDLVSGTVSLDQADTGKQPKYQLSALNGRPAVVFDTARNDHFVKSGIAGAGLEATVFVVAAKPTPASGNRYLFGSNGSPKNLYHSATDAFGLQGNTNTFTVPAVPDIAQIVAGVFATTGGIARVNGHATSGPVGTMDLAPTGFTIGHRSTLTAGQSFTGPIGEVLYYDRALTANECAAVERYLAHRWGMTITPQKTWYVNALGGNDTFSGRTASQAVATLNRAWKEIEAVGATKATILVHAPESSPLRVPTGVGFRKTDGGTVRIAPMYSGDSWHLYGTQRVTSGWTARGGGVYSVPLTIDGVVTAPFAIVTTLPDADGNPMRVTTKNTATPTTPAAGEYGYSGGTYYLHIPGDVSPAGHTVEVVSVQNVFKVYNPGSTLQIDNGHLHGSQYAVANAGADGVTGGTITATDSLAEWSLIAGWGTLGGVTAMTCTRCIGQVSENDGFNHHADAGNEALMSLTDCIGRYNKDEGVSPHDDTTLLLVRGEYHHNGSGGFTSVGSAVSTMIGTEFYNNNRISTAEGGAVSALETSTIITTDIYVHDNPAVGINVAATATWIDNGGTRSGTANGNGAEDAV